MTRRHSSNTHGKMAAQRSVSWSRSRSAAVLCGDCDTAISYLRVPRPDISIFFAPAGHNGRAHSLFEHNARLATSPIDCLRENLQII